MVLKKLDKAAYGSLFKKYLDYMNVPYPKGVWEFVDKIGSSVAALATFAMTFKNYTIHEVMLALGTSAGGVFLFELAVVAAGFSAALYAGVIAGCAVLALIEYMEKKSGISVMQPTILRIRKMLGFSGNEIDRLIRESLDVNPYECVAIRHCFQDHRVRASFLNGTIGPAPQKQAMALS